MGQESLKRVLLAVAVEDGLAGALVRGEKGTAKSTAVRGLADLLPDQRVVADCPYGCPPPGDAADPASTTARRCEACRDRTDPPVETRPTPLVTLPLGATRDRVTGTLSVSDALAGEAEFDPGLLARANRGILYVDEVNLLADHLVDVLLDAAAGGVNRVERDGVSVVHPAAFTLIGTMNPEEGELRPQLRDRFDLSVAVTGSDDLDDRVEVIDRVVDAGGNAGSDGEEDGDGGGRSGHDRDEFAGEIAALRDRVVGARERRPRIPDEFKRDAAEVCRDAGVDGHRADIAVVRTARAFAALDGRPKVIESDVREAAGYALGHRLRSRPFEEGADPSDVVDDHFDGSADGDDGTDGTEDGEGEKNGAEDVDDGDADGDGDGSDGDGDGSDGDGDEVAGDGRDGSNRGDSDAGEDETDGADDGPEGRPDGAAADREAGPDGAGDAPAGAAGDGTDAGPDDGGDGPDDGAGEPTDGETDDDGDEEATPIVPGAARAGVGEADAPAVDPPEATAEAGDEGSGRGRATPSATGRGARVRTEPADGTGSIDPAASVREAAGNGRTAPSEGDLRQSVRTDDARTLTVFVADASASMAPAMRAAKGVALELLRDAYAERDAVALIAVGGDDAELLCPPTTSVSLAARQLKALPSADRTPLPAGLDAAAELVDAEEPAAARVVIVSDGRANVADGSPTGATRAAARRLGSADCSVLVVDAGESRAGLLDVVREATDARRIPLSALSPETVIGNQ